MKKTVKITFLFMILLLLKWLDPFSDAVSEGNSNLKDGKYDEAIASYKKAEEYAPSEKDRYSLAFNKGIVYYAKGDYDEAIESYKQAVSSEDRELQKKALFNIGNAFSKKGDKEAAADAYMSALKIDPSYERAKKNLEYLVMNKMENEKNNNNDKNKNENSNNNENTKNDKNANDKDQKKNKNNDPTSGADKDKNDSTQKLSKEQVQNILESMKNKPVRREKGDGTGRRMLEKPW